MTADDYGARRRALAAGIPDGGAAWREAVGAVPREGFLGAAVFRARGAEWEVVRRAEVGEEEWARLADSDRTWVTQVGGVDAEDAHGVVAGSPTSSSTLPSLVVRMLEVAGIGEGDAVLEVGTGTGYSTALLCRRLGDDRVASVEYDPRVAARAAAALRAAGFAPALVVGDGLRGHRPGAPYDAVVATCAVRGIPFSWMAQVRDGGGITTTLSGWMLASGLIRLTVDADGGATGRFTGDQASFMLARPHERPPLPAFFPREGTTRESRIDPAVLETWEGRFLAQLGSPSAQLLSAGDALTLWDVATGSQAWTEGTTVHQHGPLRLWDQVEDAVGAWQAQGAPDQTAFGMTVDPDHTQRVWLGDPAGPSWELPL